MGKKVEKKIENKKNEKAKKGNKKIIIIVIVVILVLLVIGFISYISYDRYYRVDEEIPHDSNILEEDVVLNKEDALEYLEEIPFYGTDGYNKDAYQGDKLVTLNDIDSSVFLSFASTMLDEDQILSYKDGMPLPNGETKEDMNEDSSGYTYFKKDDLTNIIKEIYNYDLTDMKDFTSPGNKYLENGNKNYINSTFTYKDNYFITYGTVTKSLGLRVSRLDSFSNKKGVLTITEKYGVYTCNESSCVLYNSTAPTKDRGLNEENVVYRCNISDEACTYELNDNLKNNNMLKTYKHTFKLKDGEYFWESTVGID